jgi:hypothetical protein
VRPPRIELGLRVPETLVISLSLRAHIRNEKLKTQSRKANKLGINFPSLSHERLLDVSEVFYHPLGMQSTCARAISRIADSPMPRREVLRCRGSSEMFLRNSLVAMLANGA